MHTRAIKGDGTMRAHDWGRRGFRKPCPGSGRTKEDARAEQIAARREGRAPKILSGSPDSIEPEEIF
jgi:hypothetical protein